jgi:hypothetical protein
VHGFGRRGQIVFATGLLVVLFGLAAFLAMRLVPGGARSGVLVEYVGSGGFAGVTEHLVVYDDGRVVVESQRGEQSSFRLSTDELQHLQNVLGGGEWPLLSETYGEPYPDAFQTRFPTADIPSWFSMVSFLLGSVP